MTRNLFLAFALLVTVSSSAWAQLVASSELYGEGVHKFFARDYQGADQLLTEAIDNGSKDPRAYYFRGLAREMLGGGGEVDFEEGARLEASGRSGPMVGYSLVRVQGHIRVKLEKARRTARVLAAQQQALSQQAAPPATLPPVANPSTTDPFQGEGVRAGEVQPMPQNPTTPGNDATTNPFSDEPKTDTADPFGGDSKPAKDDTADPFGAPAAPATDPAGDDPFK